MSYQVVNIFDGLPNPTPDMVRSEYVDALPIFRSLQKKVLLNEKSIDQVRRSALNDDFSRTATHDFYSQTDAWAEFLEKKSHKFSYLPIIIIMLLVFPTNSAGVERIFSATAWIKNERRNRMLDDILNANLHVKLNPASIDYSLL